MIDKALFIINLISGTGKQEVFLNILSEVFDKSRYAYDTVYTKYSGHATELSKNAIKNYGLVVAVGGDGTVNEVVKGLVGSDCVMGIVPVGSGNGLARHLRLPIKIKESLQVINEGKTQRIDTGTLNEKPFVNVAGIGFDAHIAHMFANSKKRGAIPYAKIATQEFQKYESKKYEIIIEEKTYHIKAFLISFANSTQFGNNAYISPNAIINDGLLDFCILSEFPKIEAGQMAIKLFNKRMDKSKYMNIIRGTSITIKGTHNLCGHIDGEPITLSNQIEVKINKASLRVIYNSNISMLESISNKIKSIESDIFKNPLQ